MAKRELRTAVVLYPVPVVLVTCADERPNVLTVNRIAAVGAEPPMVAISLRPFRYSAEVIRRAGEFVVNLPTADMVDQIHLAGTTTAAEVDKFQQLGLTPEPARQVKPPLIKECPVNLECRVTQVVDLPSHTLFIAEVVALHADESVLDERGRVSFSKANPLIYPMAGVVERPII